MKSFCIKTNNEDIKNYLLDNFLNTNLDGMYISNHCFKIYDNIIIHYTKDNLKCFYDCLSEILCNCIIEFYEYKLIDNLIDFNYFYFNELEKKQILDSCIDNIDFSNDDFDSRKLIIFNNLHDYIQENKSMILNGFVNFRLKDYIKILDSVIDVSVNQFLVEREYFEFINILKLYVNSTKSNISEVHLIYNNNESILIDDKKNIISTDDNIFKAKYLSDISFSSNDYALNTLLNLLPKHLIIHLVDSIPDEFINTLKLIFENRISICNDCNICNIYKLNTHHITR